MRERLLVALVALSAQACDLSCGLNEAALAQLGTEPGAAEAPALALEAAGALESEEACDAALDDLPAASAAGLRVGSWNVRWFPNGSADVRRHREASNVGWLACAIAALRLDVLAVQE